MKIALVHFSWRRVKESTLSSLSPQKQVFDFFFFRFKPLENDHFSELEQKTSALLAPETTGRLLI